MNGPLGNISKLYTKLPVGIQVSEPIDRDSQASRNDASTTTGFTKSFILGKDVSDLKACLDYSYHYARSCENSNFCFPAHTETFYYMLFVCKIPKIDIINDGRIGVKIR